MFAREVCITGLVYRPIGKRLIFNADCRFQKICFVLPFERAHNLYTFTNVLANLSYTCFKPLVWEAIPFIIFFTQCLAYLESWALFSSCLNNLTIFVLTVQNRLSILQLSHSCFLLCSFCSGRALWISSSFKLHAAQLQPLLSFYSFLLEPRKRLLLCLRIVLLYPISTTFLRSVMTCFQKL